jgi:hypothetical protein
MQTSGLVSVITKPSWAKGHYTEKANHEEKNQNRRVLNGIS